MGRDARDGFTNRVRGGSRDDRNGYGREMPERGGRGGPPSRGPMAASRSGGAPGYEPQRRSRPSDPRGRGNGNGNGNGPRSVADGRGDGWTDRAPRRSMRELARDVSRSMSRQISTMMPRRGPRPQPASAEGDRPAPQRRPTPPPPSLSPEATEKLQAQAYRRSRIRLVARKWRVGRVQPNPILYLSGVLLAIVLAVTLAGGGGFGVYYGASYYQLHTGDIQAIANLKNQQNSQILDRYGKQIAVLKGDSDFNFYVPLSQISPKLRWATIDTEDRTFYSNVGIDFYGTLRAALTDVTKGGAAQGGSSITQQLVKNIVLKDSNKTYTRKMNEAILAYGVTQQYTKDQILEMYLNTVYYSGLYKGIEAASRYYFRLAPKPVPGSTVPIQANQQLDWAQTALLAALPNNPTIYLPTHYSCDKAPCEVAQWDDPYFPGHECDGNYFLPDFGPDWYNAHGHEWLDFCRGRSVLFNVLQYQGAGPDWVPMTRADYDHAVAELQDMLIGQKIYPFLGTIGTNDTATSLNLAPHFVEYVANEMADKWGVGALQTAGLRIYTTLDLSLNQYAEKQIDYYVNKPHANPWYGVGDCGPGIDCPLAQSKNAHNGSVIAIDPRNGDIMAMVGSANYNDKSKAVAGAFNVGIAPRSMGSAFKPVVYATAFQMGWTPGTMLHDQAICFPQEGGDDKDTPATACKGHYVPQNYDQNYFSGTFPARYMLGNSLNIAAVETMSFVGDSPATSDAFVSMSHRLGLTEISKDRMGPTTALGTQEVSLLELTGAYAVFANGGRRAPPRAILEVDNLSTGSVLYKAPPVPQVAQVMSPETAYMITSILTDNRARAQDFGFFKNPIHWEPLRGENYALAWAAKTGTSSGATGPRDILTIGYTPYLAVGAWLGNSDPNDDMASDIIGVAGAGYVFHDVMLWALQKYHWPTDSQFPVPSDMALGTFNCDTGLAPYKGETAAQLKCSQNPPSYSVEQDGHCNDFRHFCWKRLYTDGSGRALPQVSDTDWYIVGQAPTIS